MLRTGCLAALVMILGWSACRQADQPKSKTGDKNPTARRSKSQPGRQRPAKKQPFAQSSLPKQKRTADPNGLNLLVITLDTTRADHLGCYGYFRKTSPAIDALAAESIFFERCQVPMAQTLPSHTSLFTSVYPLEHGVLANVGRSGKQFLPSENIHSIAEVFYANGYHTAGFISATPVAIGSGIEVGFESWTQPRNRCLADETIGAVLNWLDQKDKRPFMMWIHLFDPHWPYNPPPPYDTMFRSDDGLEKYMTDHKFPKKRDGRHRRKKGEEKPEPMDWREYLNRYDAEIRQMDDQLAILFDKLREKQLWDRTVIVLTGDHGESLMQHGIEQHSHIWGEQLHVPLMIRVPGHKPKRIPNTISNVDIFPTVLALVEEFPRDAFLTQASGEDVLADGFEHRPVFSQMPLFTPSGEPGSKGKGFTMTTDRWKYVYDLRGEDRLFDLQADPLELNNVLQEHPVQAKKLKDAILSSVAEQRAKARLSVPRQIDMSDDRKAALEDLGYLGDDEEEEAEGEGDADGDHEEPGRDDK